MPRRVANEYGKDTLHLLSEGIYDVTITLLHDDLVILRSAKRSWCYEQTKGLVYTMDLSQDLPRQMGYNTPRVYLRDYLLFINGYDHKKVVWYRPDLHDYRLMPSSVYKVA